MAKKRNLDNIAEEIEETAEKLTDLIIELKKYDVSDGDKE